MAEPVPSGSKHARNLIKQLYDLRPAFCDVEIHCVNNIVGESVVKIFAHRAILSAKCRYAFPRAPPLPPVCQARAHSHINIVAYCAVYVPVGRPPRCACTVLGTAWPSIRGGTGRARARVQTLLW